MPYKILFILTTALSLSMTGFVQAAEKNSSDLSTTNFVQAAEENSSRKDYIVSIGASTKGFSLRGVMLKDKYGVGVSVTALNDPDVTYTCSGDDFSSCQDNNGNKLEIGKTYTKKNSSGSIMGHVYFPQSDDGSQYLSLGVGMAAKQTRNNASKITRTGYYNHSESKDTETEPAISASWLYVPVDSKIAVEVVAHSHAGVGVNLGLRF